MHGYHAEESERVRRLRLYTEYCDERASHYLLHQLSQPEHEALLSRVRNELLQDAETCEIFRQMTGAQMLDAIWLAARVDVLASKRVPLLSFADFCDSKGVFNAAY